MLYPLSPTYIHCTFRRSSLEFPTGEPREIAAGDVRHQAIHLIVFIIAVLFDTLPYYKQNILQNAKASLI